MRRDFFLHDYAELIHPSVTLEVERAEALAREGFYTEAVLRLGRAVEGSLYSIARELDIDLANRIISHLDKIQQSLRTNEVNILRKKSSDEVRALANVSKRLSEAIGHLTEHSELRDGELSEYPRPNEQLYRELIQLVDDDEVRRKLREYENLLRRIQSDRNCAAHAPLDGVATEFDEQAYEELLKQIEEFISALVELYVREHARRVWAQQ